MAVSGAILWVGTAPAELRARLDRLELDLLVVPDARAARPRCAEALLVVVPDEDAVTGGLDLLRWCESHHPDRVRVLLTDRPMDPLAAADIAHHLLPTDCPPASLAQLLRTLVRTELLERSHEALLQEMVQLNTDLERHVLERTRELAVANRQLQRQNHFLHKLALTDPLTGLPNRRAMERLTRTELRRRIQHPRPLAVGVIDVDHFKEINSRYLLSGGDRALVWLAQTLVQDLQGEDAIGRIGGEEFLALAPGRDPSAAFDWAEHLRGSVERGEIPFDGSTIRMTISIGIAVVAAQTRLPLNEMRSRADLALAQAKASGRNRCVIVDVDKAEGD